MPLPPFASPDEIYPVQNPDGSPMTGTVFLGPAINHPRFDVGEYTYASAFDPPSDWAARLAPYLFDFSPERLTIGKFCQIADGATFITASANHRFDGTSTFPFAIFGGGPVQGRASMPSPGPDTKIGHDVWIGQGAVILPGAQIGNGVIIGARSVVAGEVTDYTIVAGNPARPVKTRFDIRESARLSRIAWWDWPIDLILAHEAEIMGGDIAALERVSPEI